MRISIREMRNHLGQLDDLLEKEHELIITRHNKPVARVLPIHGDRPRPSHKALRERMPKQEITSELLQRLDREDR